MRPTYCALSVSFLIGLYPQVQAQTQVQTTLEDSAELPTITVKDNNTSKLKIIADTARLPNEPGYSTAAAGGVSALPVLNGFAADRLKVRIDGMEVTAACGNQMNAPMSYIAPSQVGKVRVIAGITPVSAGGDSIGGTIELSSPEPEFASGDGSMLTKGGASINFRSINQELALSGNATIANDHLSVSYSGSRVKADSYSAGNGSKVLGSMVESNNHAVTLAARGDKQQLTLRVGQQYIPYQGFPNQYMDMTSNRATFANLGYTQNFDWGKLTAKLYWQQTQHEMGFFTSERPGMMPMNTDGRDVGYALSAELPVTSVDGGVLRLGHEMHRFTLTDIWPPVAGSMMMAPKNYVNINGGTRQRVAFFAEWEQKLNERWSTLVGVRDEIVKTDTGNVQAYNTSMMNAADANAALAFNARDRAKTDNNIDLTALMRLERDAGSTYEFGYVRKSRSPNLYERYTWGRGGMAMRMTNWFGDGNGYVGDINLKPEVAHTLSATADWHSDDGARSWFVKLTPYYSYVQNYIDADVIGSFNVYGVAAAKGNLLRFANHDAQLYGLNLSWKLPVANATEYGDLNFSGKAGVTRGKRVGGGDLYHMMPLNISLALEQSKGAWNNVAELNYTARKSVVDSQRLEPVTASYTLVNLRSAYQASRFVTLQAGISNLFNRNYADALGGVYLSGLKSAGAGSLQALPGYGRSFDVGVAVKF